MKFRNLENTRLTCRRLLIFPGILFISMSSLGYEIILTRIFSIAKGYHFAYLAISIALLGYGAAGTCLRVFPRILKAGLNRLLILSAFLFSLSILGSYWLANQVPFDLAALQWDKAQIGYLFLDFIILALPFFFCGLIITGVLYSRHQETGRIYFSDLSGAGIGCFIPLLLLLFLQGEQVVFVMMAGGFLAMLCFCAYAKSRWIYATPAAILFCVLLILVRPACLMIRISPYRELMTALRYENASLLETRWNAVSRIDIIDSPAVRFAPGLSIRYLEPLPKQTGLAVDGGNLQAFTSIEDGKMDFLGHLPSSLSHYLVQDPDVFIYDFGGGLDIISSLYFGAENIDATERNPGIVASFEAYYQDAAQSQPAGFDFKRVKLFTADGRNFLNESKTCYDLVLIPQNDALGASASLFSSGEDFRFTVEAFRTYYAYLNEGGFISVTRYLKPAITEEAKLFMTIFESLEGLAFQEKSLVAIRSWGTMTTLVKRGSLQSYEIEIIKAFCSQNGFDLVYYPGMPESEANLYNKFSEPVYFRLYHTLLDDRARASFLDQYLFDVSPSTDDAPFFYHYFSLNRLKAIFKSFSGKWPVLVQGGFLVPLVVLQAFLLSMILILLPGLVKRKKPERNPPRGSNILPIMYFISIAAGYMFFEIAMIHRTALLFENPVYAMAVILFALLISSGLGSLYSGRKRRKNGIGIAWVTLIIAGLILVFGFTMPATIGFMMNLPRIWRLISLMLMIFPAGFLMGQPFPLGLGLVGQTDQNLLPWLCSANSCVSVISAPLSMTLAVSIGFSGVFLASGMTYLLAMMFMVLFHRFVLHPSSGQKQHP